MVEIAIQIENAYDNHGGNHENQNSTGSALAIQRVPGEVLKLGLKLEGGAYTLKAMYLPGNHKLNTILRTANHLIDTVISKLEEERK